MWIFIRSACWGTSNECPQHKFLWRCWESYTRIIIKYSSVIRWFFFLISPWKCMFLSRNRKYIYRYPLLSGAMKIALGPVVQNLMKFLANLMLKFLSGNMANTVIFFAEKNVSSFLLQNATYICAAKNISVFENTSATIANKFVINRLVKLTLLWMTGPW